MPKTKTAKVATTVDSPTVKAVLEDFNSNGHAPDYQLIPIEQLQPSPTNPRKRFPQNSIDELAISIGEKGIIEPLIVRYIAYKTKDAIPVYEIVCGERRYKAALQAKLKLIPCMKRDLTDNEVLDIQIHENLHREDVHPMDEAYGYQFLQEKLGCDIAELALRVGKSESYILNRLKLNQLIPEIQKDIEDNHLNLSMGLEIAKYSPEGQKLIYGELYEDARYDHKLGRNVVTEKTDKEFLNLRTPAAVTEWASREILHLLAKAPFDVKAENLRVDGLACVNCPQRTGANAGLFDPEVGKKDSCLDPACYESKIAKHIQVTREKIAHKSAIGFDEVPIVKSWSHSNGDGYLGRMDAKMLSGPNAESKAKCKSSITGVDIYGDQRGKTVEVCLRSSGCKVHWKSQSAATVKSSSSSASSSSGEKSAKEKAAFYKRKEEIWNVKIGEEVRKRVFAIAAGAFAKTFSVKGGGDTFVASLDAKLWQLYSDNYINRRARDLARDVIVGHMQVKSLELGGEYNDGGAGTEKKIAKLSDDVQKRLFYLLLNGHKGDMGGGYWVSQAPILTIAGEWKIDYKLIDAQVRVELSAKKHAEAHKAYLISVEAGKKASIPAIYSETWKPKD